mgnify:CR=1 FL=1
MSVSQGMRMPEGGARNRAAGATAASLDLELVVERMLQLVEIAVSEHVAGVQRSQAERLYTLARTAEEQ